MVVTMESVEGVLVSFQDFTAGVLKVFQCVPGIFWCFFEGPQAAGETARVPEHDPEVLQGIQES